MFNDARVYLAIMMYMFGGVFMMVFNFVEMYRMRVQEMNEDRANAKWRGLILLALPADEESIADAALPAKHERLLLRKLKNATTLINFANALTYFKEKRDITAVYGNYMQLLGKTDVFQQLAFKYRSAKVEERAYFAYFISLFPEVAGEGYSNLLNLLVDYIRRSNIYCRTNVVKALCHIGNPTAVVKALDVIDGMNLYMNSRFLADELMAFRGDKEALALFLWDKHQVWNPTTMVAVVTYINMTTDAFREVFMPVLLDERNDMELRIAIIRYYRKYKHQPVRDVLIRYLTEAGNINLSIVSAHALSSYPGEETTAALNATLRSSNWHLRYNSAINLVDLGTATGDMEMLTSVDDRYAKEIIHYMMQLRNLVPTKDETESAKEGVTPSAAVS